MKNELKMAKKRDIFSQKTCDIFSQKNGGAS